MRYIIGAVVVLGIAAYLIWRNGIIHFGPSGEDLVRKHMPDPEDAHPSPHYSGKPPKK